MSIKPKKSLGQNFLINEQIINKITDIVKIKNKNILEIGPGTGNLTAKILEKQPKLFIAIEKDNELANNLKEKFKDNLTVINDDVLKINENKIHDQKLTVFGNLPYNISTEILCKWILNINSDIFWFDNLILMFQKEVADRIIALPNSKNYSRLTIISNWKLNIKKVCDIKSNNFYPSPKIDSTVLFFEPKKNITKIKDPKNLEYLTRVFFSHRRKMIKKPFNMIFNGKIDIAEKLGIDLNLRPQNLDFETYYNLVLEYERLRS